MEDGIQEPQFNTLYKHSLCHIPRYSFFMLYKEQLIVRIVIPPPNPLTKLSGPPSGRPRTEQIAWMLSWFLKGGK